MVTSTTPLSIADIEQQIAKTQIALDKARAQQLLNAEKALANAHKIAAATQKKITDLTAKASTTPAAHARLAATQTLLAQHIDTVTHAESALAAVLHQRKTAAKIAKKASKILSKSNKGKRSKAQKKHDKKAKKAAKKIARQAQALLVDTQTITASKVSPSIKTLPTKAVRKAPARPRTKATTNTSVASVVSPSITTQNLPEVVTETDTNNLPVAQVIDTNTSIEQIDTNPNVNTNVEK